MLIAAAISAMLAIYVARHRHVPAAEGFLLLMAPAALWSFAYALELAGNDLPTRLFWNKVQYLGASIVPIGWLVFTLQYTGREKWLTRSNLFILGIIPALTLV